MSMQTTSGKSNHAAAAAMIRAELKRRGFKCSVTSESYSMGNSVRVRIVGDLMPATVKAINAYCDQFQYGHFDGMIDCYEYSNRRDDLPQSKYVHVEIEYSEAIKSEVKAYLANIGNMEDYERRNLEWPVLNGSWGSFWTKRKPHVRAEVQP